MNVLHVSTHDSGGAGEAAYRIHDAMYKAGAESRFLCLYKSSSRKGVISYSKFSPLRNFFYKIKHRASSLFGRHDPDYYYFDNGIYAVNNEWDLLHCLGGFKPDRIILYWISGFINPRVISTLSKRADLYIYWYLTDMAPLTGGCHFAWSCKGFHSSCGRCPAIFSSQDHDQARITHQRKREMLQGADLTIISPNAFVTRQIRSSSIFGKSALEEIHFGVDSEFFSPGNKTQARIKLGLPVTKKIIFFGASNIKEKRKGFKYLFEAIASLSAWCKESDVILCSAGIVDRSALNIDVDCKHFGKVGYETLRDLYVAADVAVIPSIEDSGPLMTSEVLMTGTPVVAFDIGIASELVSSKTGYLAKRIDAKDLEFGISSVLRLPDRDYEEMCAKCREIAVAHLDSNKVTKKLLTLLHTPRTFQ